MPTQDQLLNRLAAGAIGGFLATVPMTMVMRAWHKQLPRNQQYSLPPEVITTRVARSAGADADPNGPGWEWKTYAGHFGFGASAGALYGLAGGQGLRSSPIVKGVAWGMLVWSSSYLGWLPAANLHPRATHEPAQRNGLMIVAHVVWGATLGLVSAALLRRPVVARRSRVTRRVETAARGLRSALAPARA